jgi:hypothetical protein
MGGRGGVGDWGGGIISPIIIRLIYGTIPHPHGSTPIVTPIAYPTHTLLPARARPRVISKESQWLSGEMKGESESIQEMNQLSVSDES